MELYLVTNLINGKRYVGQTKYSKEDRWRAHCSDARRNVRGSFCLAIRKYGPENFCVETLVPNVSDKRMLDLLERHFIALYKTYPPALGFGYNNTPGGDASPMSGKQLTKEHKAKLRAANLGNKHAQGHKHSPEIRRKLSQSFKGRTPWNKGKSISPTHRAKTKANHAHLSGEAHPMFGRRGLVPWNKGKKGVVKMQSPPMLGKKHSEATIESMRQAQRRRREREAEAKIADFGTLSREF